MRLDDWQAGVVQYENGVADRITVVRLMARLHAHHVNKDRDFLRTNNDHHGSSCHDDHEGDDHEGDDHHHHRGADHDHREANQRRCASPLPLLTEGMQWSNQAWCPDWGDACTSTNSLPAYDSSAPRAMVLLNLDDVSGISLAINSGRIVTCYFEAMAGKVVSGFVADAEHFQVSRGHLNVPEVNNAAGGDARVSRRAAELR